MADVSKPEPSEWEHGATVLPGVPLPAPARPREPVHPEPPSSHEAPPAPAPASTPPAPQPPATAPAVSPAANLMPEAADTPAVAPVSASAPPADGPVAPAPGPSGPGRHRAPEREKPAARRRLLPLLVLVGVVVVLAAVAAFVWPGLLLPADDDSGTPAPRASRTASSSAPASASTSIPAATFTTPATLAGLTKVSGAADTALTDTVARSSVPGLTDPVTAVYGPNPTTATVQVIAWRATAPQASDSIDAAFTGFEGSTGGKVSAVMDVPAPSGRMSCGLTTVQQVPSLLCFWSDAASFGSVTVLRPTSRAAATTTARAVRTGVEQLTPQANP